MTEIDYEIETDVLRQWSEQRPLAIVVTLYRVDHTETAGTDYTTNSTTRRRIQTWKLPVDAEGNE